MATRVLTRSLLTTKQAFSLLRLRPLTAVASNFRHLSPAVTSIREYATRQTTSSLNDSNPNWSNRPPKETILLDGCDFEHWLVVMEQPEGDPTRDDIIDSYIKTLAMVVGSEEEARMKIYCVSTRCYFAFGALVSEELSYKLKELPRVRWVLPDSYLNVKNKDYGGEPFINGQAVPYDPKYHEEWVCNHENSKKKNRRNDRPRNFDRPRNIERRRDNMQNQMGNQGMQSTGPNRGGPPSNIGGVPPSNMEGGIQHNNMGGAPNMGGLQRGNMIGAPNMGGMQPNVRGLPPNYMPGSTNIGGVPVNNMGGMPNNAPNFQQRNGPSNGGMPYQPGLAPNREHQNSYAPNMAAGSPYQTQTQTQNMPGNHYRTQDMPVRDMPPPPNSQNSYAPNMASGSPYNTQDMAGGNHYWTQDMSGRDVPPLPNSQNSYAPNIAGGNPYRTQDMPGRDMPTPPNSQNNYTPNTAGGNPYNTQDMPGGNPYRT